MSDNDTLVVTFRADKVKNETKSRAAGRPIFDDMEQCVIRAPGDRNTVKVFPAHAFHQWVTNGEGEQEQQTYAQRWNSQYRRFKENRTQVQEGTPLSELPFLTEAKRAEMKALNIHTAETLASLDGANLKTLGIGGRELKDQAQAYIDNATSAASVTRMAAEIAALKEQIASMSGQATTPTVEPEPEPPAVHEQTEFASWSDDDLKEWVASLTGAKPRGNPSHDTLVRLAIEASENRAAA